MGDRGSTFQDSIRILNNARTLTISQIIFTISGIFLTFLTARHLGIERFGVLTIALATVSMFNMLNDLGLSTLTVREISQDRSRLRFNLSYVGSLEILLSVCASLLVIIIFGFSEYPPETKWVYMLLGVRSGIDGMSRYFKAIFRGFEKMGYFSLVVLVDIVLRLAGIVVAVQLSTSMIPIVLAYFIASLVAFVVSLSLLKSRFERSRLKISFRVWGDLLKRALPFATFSVFNLTFERAPVVLVGLFLGDVAGGLYGAAYRVYSMALLLAITFRQGMFPRFAAIAGSGDHERAQSLLSIALRYMIALSLPISIGIFFLAGPIIDLGFSEEYAAAAQTLQILAFGFVPVYAGFILASVALAFNREKTHTIIFGACLVLNVLFNVWLIPQYGPVGAAVANTAFLVAYFIILFLYVQSFLKPAGLWRRLGKVMVAGATLALCQLLLKQVGVTGLWLPMLVGGLTYPVALYGTGFFSDLEKHAIQGKVRQYIDLGRGMLNKISGNDYA